MRCLACLLLWAVPIWGFAFTIGNPIDSSSLGGGNFSDSDSSNGSYFYSQTVAEFFELEQVDPDEYYLANHVQWYGLSEAFIDPDIGNVSGFEVNVFRDGFGLPGEEIASYKTSVGDLSAVVYSVNSGNPIYQFDLDLPAFMNLGSGGDFWIQIGASLVDGQSDAFVWATGVPNDGYVAAKLGTPWSEWMPLEDSSDSAFLITGQVVPEPGAFELVFTGLTVAVFLKERFFGKNA